MSSKKRAKPKKESRKPVSRPKQICMSIYTVKNISNNKILIENFVMDLYTNKRWDDPFTSDEIMISFDTAGKRVCITLNRKVNATYLKLEDINAAIKPKHLKVNSDIKLGAPTEDILVHHLSSTTKTKVPQGHKWVTLSHNGPYFTWIMEPYKPHNVPISYNGKKYKLSSKAEEVANFWAKRITTDETATVQHTEDVLFRSNFWKDFKTYLSAANKKAMPNFDKMNFEAIRNKLIQIKESETDNIKKDKKKASEDRKHDYGYAMVNGVKEAVSNFVPEPAGLFLGRGKNKLRGRVKKDINPSDVTINIGNSSKVPIPPIGKWKKVVHDTKAEWISKWSDPLNGKPKYIRLSDQGQFKSDSDAGKFENARKLNKFLDTVRNGYQKNIDSSNKISKQLSTVIWLVDQYGIRMGGEKGELEAKTYGASTLLVKHISFPKGDKITLDFLGKDSIRYNKTLIIDTRVVNNLKDFIKGKSKNTPLFDLVNANAINCYLKTFDKGLKGKVFRTRLGSTLMYEELSKTKIKKNATESDKKKAFVNANIIVAKALNHQKTIAKGAVATLDKLKVQLKELEKELKEKKKAGTKVASLEKRVKAKKDSIDSKKKLQEISTGTSLTNYIDPRLVTSWCKAHNLPIEKVYTKTLQDKFKWAIDETDDKWDYKNSQLLPDFEKLQPSNDTICDTYNSKTTKKPIVIKKNKDSDDSSDDNKPIVIKKNTDFDDKNIKKINTKDLIHNKNKAIIESYRNILKKYGYSLLKLDNNRLAVQRVTSPKLVMQLTSTYKDIYEISNKLENENLGVLGMLLIGQVCFDATKNVKIKKALVKSGYIEKYKELVRKAF
jgi:DNA topoisomerase-1